MHNAVKSQNIRSHRGTLGAIEALVTIRLQALPRAAMQLGRARSPCLGRLLSFLSRIQLPPLLRLFVPSLFLISMPNFFLQSWITLFFRYLNWIVQLEKGSDLTPVLLSRCSNRCSASSDHGDAILSQAITRPATLFCLATCMRKERWSNKRGKIKAKLASNYLLFSMKFN